MNSNIDILLLAIDTERELARLRARRLIRLEGPGHREIELASWVDRFIERRRLTHAGAPAALPTSRRPDSGSLNSGHC